MAHKNTVAILGATTAVGTIIAKSIAASYRLLLMDMDQSKLVSLQADIQAMDKTAEMDFLQCCKNASWEADIIVVSNDGENLDELAVKMKEVSNCKTVVHFTAFPNNIDKLQHLLPHAQVVTILWSKSLTDDAADAFIRGRNNEAVEIAKEIVAAMANEPQVF